MTDDRILDELRGRRRAPPPSSVREKELPGQALAILLVVLASAGVAGASLALDHRVSVVLDASEAPAARSESGVRCQEMAVSGRPTWEALFESLLLPDEARDHALILYNRAQNAAGDDEAEAEDQIPEGALAQVCNASPETHLRASPEGAD